MHRSYVYLCLYVCFALLAVAGPADAFFEPGQLVQVVYNIETDEVVTDLLVHVTSDDFSEENLELAPAGTVKVGGTDSHFQEGLEWEDLRLSFFTEDNDDATYFDVFISTTKPIEPNVDVDSFWNLHAGVQTTMSWARGSLANGTRTITYLSDDPNKRSHAIIFNNGNISPGIYAQFNYEDREDGEATLEALDDSDGYVDMYLYQYRIDGDHENAYLLKGSKGDYVAVLRLKADGSTVLNPPVVDDCPNDPNKTAPGACGCGVPDTDTDQDGEADCQDEDDDNDDMPDTYEEDYPTILDPLDPSDRNNDADEDGITNYQEYASGDFDPTDSTSLPQRPTAIAGSDQTVTGGSTVNLDGAASSAGTNAIATYAWTWTQTGGDAADISLDTTAATPSFQAPAVGRTQDPKVYEFTLTVTDAYGIEAAEPDTVVVTVETSGENTPPGAPTLSAPANDPPSACQYTESDRTPALVVSDAVDIDGDSLHYLFEVYADAGLENFLLDSGWIDESEDDDDDASDEFKTWRVVAPLDSNRFYYWRVRACDGDPDGGECDDAADGHLGSWMSPARVFINPENDPPPAPVLDQPVGGGSVGSLRPALTLLNVAYANDTDAFDTYTYEFQVSDADDFATILQENAEPVVEQETSTQWSLPEDLREDTQYYWRARALDDGGGGAHTPLTGPWSDPAAFMINTDNQTPTDPEIHMPPNGADVTALPAILSVRNATDADPQDVLAYAFEVVPVVGDAEPDWTSDAVMRLEPDEQEAYTQVRLDNLVENTRYYWRVQVTDGQAVAQSETVWFIMNAANDPPGVPQAYNPESGSIVDNLAPTLTILPVVDPDDLNLTYLFELFEGTDWDNPVATSGEDYTDTSWSVAGLENHSEYFWRVTAADGRGGETASDHFKFTTRANYIKPSVPTINSPFPGGTVDSLKPTLSVNVSEDEDTPELTYRFELNSSPVWTEPLFEIEITATAEDILVSAAVSVALEDGQTYYWRVRADDGEDNHLSAWMPTAAFTVNVSGFYTPIEVVPALSEIAYAAVDTDQSFEVKQTTTASLAEGASGMEGVCLVVPSGSLEADVNVMIGEALRGPNLPVNKKALGKVVFFGPYGSAFKKTLNGRIPYAVEDGGENAAALGDNDDIQLLNYDIAQGEWVPVTAVYDEAEAEYVFDIDTLSLYTLTQTVKTTTPPADDGGGGGGGGCFLQSLVP